MEGNNKSSIVDAELLPATIDSARTLALIAKETPEVIMARAIKCAKVLKDVIMQKKDPVTMDGEIYFEIEDWATLGNFYNGVARAQETKYVQFGNAAGFECKAAVVDKLTGQVITTAEAMCLNDEKKWSARTKYAYHYVLKDGSTSAEDPGPGNIVWEDNPEKPGKKRPKKEKVNAGMVAVPLFQLRSMAQTRACAKALRLAYGWVVVLAGYKATPAEELDGMTDKDKGQSQAPAAAASKPAADKKAPAKQQAPVQMKAKGRVLSHVPPKGNSKYTKFFVGTTEQDKVQVETADPDFTETMMGHGKAQDVITVECEESVNGIYTNRYITSIAVDPKDNDGSGAAQQ